MRSKTFTTHKSNFKLASLIFLLLTTNLFACKSSLEEELSPVDDSQNETVISASELGEVSEKGSFHLKGYTLKEVFDFPIGAAVVKERLDQKIYSSTLKREFSRLSSESDFKFHILQPSENNFDYTKADAIVAYAQKNNMQVHGHTLIWSLDSMTPRWVLDHKGGAKEFEKLLKNHITTVLKHFKGKVSSWDVVNEAITGGGLYRDNIWLRKIGEDYLLKAFKYASEADPDAILFANDYSMEYGGKKMKKYLKIIDEAKSKGIKFDGIGLQMHAVIRQDTQQIEDNLKIMAKSGVAIHLSEFDVALRYRMPRIFPLTDELARRQGDMYKQIVKSYLKVVPKKQQFGITTWGVADKDSYFNRGYANSDHDHPLLFGKDYKAKWAYRGFIEAGLGR